MTMTIPTALWVGLDPSRAKGSNGEMRYSQHLTHPTTAWRRCGTDGPSGGESLLSSSRSLFVLLDVTAQVPRMESTYLPRRAGADAACRHRARAGGCGADGNREVDFQLGGSQSFRPVALTATPQDWATRPRDREHESISERELGSGRSRYQACVSLNPWSGR